MSDKPKRKGGGVRANDKKRAAKAAQDERPADYKQRTIAARRRQADPNIDPRQLAGDIPYRIALLAVEAERDPGPPPEQTREQAARLWSLAGKNIDSAKIRAEVDELLALLNRGGKATDSDGDTTQ